MDLTRYTNPELRAFVDEHIHSARDRRIIVAFYADDMSYDEIADAEHLSPRRIGEILRDFRKIAKKPPD